MTAGYIVGLALLALGSVLVLYGALTDWTPDQPVDYEKKRRRR